MVLYFTGTGNSRYLARRIAEGLEMPLYDLNACIKAGDTAPVQTGRDMVLVTPTYAWRIPRVVSEWLGKTALPLKSPTGDFIAPLRFANAVPPQALLRCLRQTGSCLL